MPVQGAARARVTKADVIASVAERLGFDTPRLSTGSTEPRAFFESVDTALGLGLVSTTKQGMAREIVERSGARWEVTYESAGATVTFGGLQAVADAVGSILSARESSADVLPSFDAAEVLGVYPDWTSCAEAAMSDELTLLEEIADLALSGIEAPTVGDEVCDGVPLSIAWGSRRIAVVTAGHDAEMLAALRAAGWIIVEPVASAVRAALSS